jgi:16S rRNA (cytosine1402-N4)-methyltransferase
MTDGERHISVLKQEVVQALAPKKGEIFVDATFGAGGYSLAILAAADCTVFAIDRDPNAIAAGRVLPEVASGRLHLLHGRFSEMEALLRSAGIKRVDGVTMDLGVSSMQIDEAARGFSFMLDGPLDMRMSEEGETAADIVNKAGEVELADIIFQFGEERRSRAIAEAIVAARTAHEITRTSQLVDIIIGVLGYHRGMKVHPATRTFQALRIHVNREMDELDQGLRAAEKLLAPGGRIAAVSFHSLEDRRVKRFLLDRSGSNPRGSRHQPPEQAVGPAPTFELLRRGTIKPSKEETRKNPRARSARLRVAIRTNAPAWSEQEAA